MVYLPYLLYICGCEIFFAPTSIQYLAEIDGKTTIKRYSDDNKS